MKRVFTFKNSVTMTAVMAGLLFVSTSFTFSPSGDASLADESPQKKEQHIKVVVNKGGKEIKIDTTFNLPNEKMVQLKVDSILKKLDIESLEASSFDKMARHHGNRMYVRKMNGRHFPGDEQFDILIQNGDSGMRKHFQKMIYNDNDSLGYLVQSDDDDLMAPMPPMPPMPPRPPRPPFIFEGQFNADQFAVDSKDESIISYEKKDIGKGLEKITIIRKKRPENKNIEFMDEKLEKKEDDKK